MTTTDAWRPVLQEDFADDSFRDRWVLEGFADLALERDKDLPHIRIATTRNPHEPKNRQSVLWCKQRFSGNVRVTFRAKGATANRAILYFNAVPTPESGHRTIFDWDRPDAEMIRYAGDSRIAMYTLGMLRDDQNVCNLRYIGGSIADAYTALPFDPYQQASIIKAYDSAFRDKPDTWFDFDIRVVGRRIALDIDGVNVFDVQDTGCAELDEWRWESLTEGGWIGFRNFVPNDVCVGRVRVYT